MIIAAEYSFNNGHSIQETHPYLLWDLEQRGVADIDIPVLIFGIDM